MPTKAQTKRPEAVKPPKPAATLTELHQAIEDVRWAHGRSAHSARCKRCGIGDSYRMDQAVSMLLKVVLELPRDDLDLLIADA